MHGREHLVGITAHSQGLVLLIPRYADELRKPLQARRQRQDLASASIWRTASAIISPMMLRI
jgi:non-homologous end joining protein Ku